MLGISSRSSCRKCFKNLELLPITSLYIYSLILFVVVDNFHYFQSNSSVHEINTRYKNHLQIPSVRFAAIQGSATYSAIKVFNKLHSRLSRLKSDKNLSSLLLRNITHMFHSIEEFCQKISSSFIGAFIY